jgi:hypothetical protein
MSTTLNTNKLESITNDLTTSVSPPKRGRGRPAKYAKEEREEKYKESRDQWAKDNMDRRYELNDQYGQRVRLAYKLLCDIWNKHYLDKVDDPICLQIKDLVENKKIII